MIISRSQPADEQLRPFYFIVVVWGERYVDYLLNFCIPALLAPRNLPALHNSGNRLVVVTTVEDWQRMSQSKQFAALRPHAEPAFLELPPPREDESVYDRMSAGHRLATRCAFRDKAYGVLLTPDLLLSDGSVETIQRLAADGAQVVLAAALRYGEEPLFEQLEKMGVTKRDGGDRQSTQALAISSRQMVSAAVNSLHSETLRFEWDAPYFTPFFTGLPGGAWWSIAGHRGILLHTASWAAVLIDYGTLGQHDESTMEHWAVDGDYVYRNFGTQGRIHVIQDSDDLMLVSWTRMNVGDLPLRPKMLLRLAFVADFVKGCLLRDALMGPLSDPLKRKIVSLPVHLHASEIDEAWEPVKRRAADVIGRYLLEDRGAFIRTTMRTIGTAYRVYAVMIGRWRHRSRIWGMLLRAGKGDRIARDYLRRRTKLYWSQLKGRSAAGE